MPSRRTALTQPGAETLETPAPLIGVIMGSKSDWDTMRHAAEVLEQFEVPHECRVVSAHRTPEWMCEYARTAEERGLRVIIAGAGGAAHLPGMIAAQTTLPVLGVPVQSRALQGLDSLLSIVQMPGGIPVGTPPLRDQLRAYHDRQRQQVLSECEL
ncbi:MAG: 5-(carboxyamino)imidazole ribonucleotide mutase [Pirellulaceae bacterium]|nr:5-(carboxyamino)imidazole ribonucleotide mutase [Pirellulaceae bacterium]